MLAQEPVSVSIKWSVQVKLRCNDGTGTSRRLKCLSIKCLQHFKHGRWSLDDDLRLNLPASLASGSLAAEGLGRSRDLTVFLESQQ